MSKINKIKLPTDIYANAMWGIEESRKQLETVAGVLSPHCPEDHPVLRAVNKNIVESWQLLSKFKFKVEIQLSYDELGLETIDGLPVFPCRVLGRSSKYADELDVVFHCPHCETEHQHGWPLTADPNKPQHRSAHCTQPPLNGGKGYYIVPDTEGRIIIEMNLYRPKQLAV